MLKDIMTNLNSRARWGLAAGAVAVLAATVAAAWLLRTDDQVLFADLKPQDAALMAAELDRQKIPYRVSNDGSTLLVDGGIVHTTRLKLMGKDMPLHGAAGFELFNNGDFGMTEFAQKINYQRALQGEITRTILALSEVRDARVHLALPEESLFKRSNARPKAAITLSLKAGETLRPDQVNGIQRLVAGAVPAIAAQDVTIVDQHGVALTRVATQDGDADPGSGRLDLKRELERLLTRKATDVLERAFGAGQAMASVDVTLNMDQVRVTTEDVIGSPGHPGQAPTGVVVREREVMRDVAAPLAGPQDAAGRAGNSQREVEYQVGRRVEQVVTQPGAIRRLHVAAVVRNPMDAQQLEQARSLLSAAVGGVTERGDTIVIQTLKAFDAPVAVPQPVATRAEGGGAPAGTRPQGSPAAMAAVPAEAWGAGAVLLVVLFALLAFWLRARRAAEYGRPYPLTEAERQVLTGQLKLWLEQGRQAEARLPEKGIAQRLPELRP